MSTFDRFEAFLARHEDSMLFQIGCGCVVAGIFGGLLLILKVIL